MTLSRRLKAIIGVAVVLILLLVSHQRENISQLPSAVFGPSASRPKPPVEQSSEKPVGNSDTISLIPPSSDAQLVLDAHKLPAADAFMGHFAAVRRIKGLTIQEAKQTCTWRLDEYVDFQFNPDVEWVVTDRSEAEIASKRAEWRDFVADKMIPWDLVKDRFAGRGIIIVAGNQDTLMRVKVILRQLKRLNSNVAIELHYWENEMDQAAQDELTAMYQPMTFNDLSKGHNIVRVQKDRFWINYQLKAAAVVNSRFAEPLLLDSDNVPIIDPALLWDSKVYAEYGTVFWPDIARTRPQNPAWAITNTPCKMDEHEQESGQMLVDKRRYWYHIQLASWMNSDYYSGFLLGDKDTFRFAWHALKTAYGKPARWLTSVGTENDGFYCGHSFAQHHPDLNDGRVAFLHGGLVKTVSLEVMRWNREVKGSYFRSYKRAPSDTDPSVNVNVAIKFDGAAYIPGERPADFQWAQCTDMFNVSTRNLADIIPGWERTFTEIGGYWQLEKEDSERQKQPGPAAMR